MLEEITRTLSDSALREAVIWLLFNVPGLPPILQSIHILTVAVIVGTIGLTHLRILELALLTQDPLDLVRRYQSVLSWALLVALITGVAFVIARPGRYFLNPVAGGKFAFLALAILFTYWAFGYLKKGDLNWRVRALSGLSVVAWIGVIFGGRWIAYVDYLYWD